ncbi:unnamed protein product [Brassica oleracea var. botrytis]
MRIVSLTIRDISSPSTKERCVSLTVFNWLKTVSNLIFYVFFFLTVSFDDQIQLMTLSWSTFILLVADGILNRWVCSQCKHFQIYDKGYERCYEAKQRHEDMKDILLISSICMYYKSTSKKLRTNFVMLRFNS